MYGLNAHILVLCSGRVSVSSEKVLHDAAPKTQVEHIILGNHYNIFLSFCL